MMVLIGQYSSWLLSFRTRSFRGLVDGAVLAGAPPDSWSLWAMSLLAPRLLAVVPHLRIPGGTTEWLGLEGTAKII